MFSDSFILYSLVGVLVVLFSEVSLHVMSSSKAMRSISEMGQYFHGYKLRMASSLKDFEMGRNEDGIYVLVIIGIPFRILIWPIELISLLYLYKIFMDIKRIYKSMK